MTRLAVGPEDVQEGVELPSLAVMDAVRATFALYRKHFLTFALVMGLLAAPNVLIWPISETWILDFPPPPEQDAPPVDVLIDTLRSMGIAGVKIVILAMSVAPFGVLAAGAAVLVTVHAMYGRSMGAMTAYRQVLGRVGTLLVTDLVLGLGIMTVALTCVGIFTLPFVLPGIEFTNQTILLERRTPIAAIQRSWQFAKGHRWRIIRSQGVIVVICWLLISLPVYVLHWVAGVSHDNPLLSEGGLAGVDSTTRAVWIADQVLYLLDATFLWSLYYIQSTVLYLDLRARERPYHLPIRPSPDEQLPG